MAETAKSPETRPLHVTLDTLEADVLKSVQAKKKVTFDAKSFKTLPDEITAQFDRDTARLYWIAYGIHQQLPAVTATAQIKISPRLATAKSRLDLTGCKPDRYYYWARPDELRERQYEGYRITDNPDVIGFGDQKNGPKRVGVAGDDELVLMDCPLADKQARDAARAQSDQERAVGVERAAAEEMRKAGGQPYIPDANDARRPWKEN